MGENNYAMGVAVPMTENKMKAAELSTVAESGLTKKDVLCRMANHDLMDEIIVCNKYLDYYHGVKDECPHTAHICAEMAKDEFTHARAQRDLLLENGYEMTDEGEDAYHDLKERIEKLFR